jgi:hypothetical protein
MLFDVSAIEAQHRPLIQNGNLGDAYRAATFGCVRLIEDVVHGQNWNDEHATVVVVDLGVRIINDCGAAAQLAVSGFWSAAGHQVRDLVECHQLIEYFRHRPSDAQEWFESSDKERYKKFGFGKVFDKLAQDRGASQFDLKQSFDFFSNAGSHPSIAGFAWQMTDVGQKLIGPVPHPDRFRLFVGDLWAHATRATLDFVDTIDALNSDRKPIRDQFCYSYAVVAGARKLLTEITAEQIREFWK